MDKNRRQTPFVNIGSSLLLVVFLLLCLITFATLSFSSAKSDGSFSQRIAQRRSAYYEASNQAERLLAQIDGILTVWEDLDDLDFDVIDSIDADITYDPKESTISYQVPINDKQALEVVLDVHEDKTYQIKKWQTITTQKWESDDTLQLMPIP